MPRAVWPLADGRPVVQVELHTPEVRSAIRTLLADTGAGTIRSEFELILDEDDCLLCGGRPFQSVKLRGAYHGTFPVYLIHVRIPVLGQDRYFRAAGVRTLPPGLDGIACFRFLSRFTFGNFGSRDQFGIEDQ